jgi:rhamnosyltransferase
MLVVMAHFDVDRTLRAHTRRALENYAWAADRVVVVSTSGIQDRATEGLPANVEIVTRGNFGYDFYSYKWGLDVVGDYPDYDRILIANDSFVGPTVPVEAIVESAQCQSVDMMGMTLSQSHGTHTQSFFFTVNQRVARSNAFRRFWKDMVPVSDRTKVIASYEVGLSQAVLGAGFTVGGYLQPSTAEETLARRRFEHQSQVRLHIDLTETLVGEKHVWDDAQLNRYNPVVALADRVLLGDRLPLLKFDTLRFDPYELGAPRLLAACERLLPEQFDGVRAFLRETRALYPFRRGENNILASERSLRETGRGYLMDEAFMALADGENR